MKDNSGFTLTEFLLGLVLLALAMGFLIPNSGCTSYTKARENAKEVETNSNLHTILMAIERFAVDTGGEYPLILYGGDASDTFATADSPPPPYDEEYKYWDGDVDILLVKGYLKEYPTNPFTRNVSKERIVTNPGENGFGPLELTPGRVNIWASPHDRSKEYIRREVGGKNGDLMWDVSEGQRHPPWPIVVVPDPKPSMTGYINPIPEKEIKTYPDDHQFWLTPGNFYYYATFDGMAGYSAFVDTNGDGIGESDNPVEGKPIGYILVGYGAVRNTGMDVYNLYGDYGQRSLFTMNLPGNLYVGPDGREDGVIITLASGMDRKREPVEDEEPDADEEKD